MTKAASEAASPAPSDSSSSVDFPFTKEEEKELETILEELFEKEKMDGQVCGEIICPLTLRTCCFCPCGPHLLCPKHHLNCVEWWEGTFPDGMNQLLFRWLKWRTSQHK